MKAFWLDNLEPIELETLAKNGVSYRSLPLTEYQSALNEIKRTQNYVEQDIVELKPETPNLDAILAKFDKEHRHTDDEVRFVLAGAGIFDIRSSEDRWMRVEVSQGDYISVPKDRNHRFYLTEEKFIRCVRLFKDNSGWTPLYRVVPQTAAL